MKFSIKDFFSKCDQIRFIVDVWQGPKYAWKMRNMKP